MKKYAITATFVKSTGKTHSDIVSRNNVIVREQKSSKVKAEGYRISEIYDINEEDPSKYKIGKEVTEFSYRKMMEGNEVVGVEPATPTDDDAVTVKYPFTTEEAWIFIAAYGETDGLRGEIHNARTVVRSNLSSGLVKYVASIGAPIEKSLIDPRLKEKITDANGNVKPFFKQKFGKNKSGSGGSAKDKKAQYINAISSIV